MNRFRSALLAASLLLSSSTAFAATLLVLSKEDQALAFLDPATGK